MVQMRMGQEQINFRWALLGDFATQFSQARTPVKDQASVRAHYFQTGGIAAITQRIGTGAGDAAARPPELNVKLLMFIARHAGILLWL